MATKPGTSPFARLFHSPKPAAAKAEADDDKKKDDDKKDDTKKDEAGTKKAKRVRAEGDTDGGDEHVGEVLDDAEDDAEDEVADPDADGDEEDEQKTADAKKAKAKAAAKKAAAAKDDDEEDEGDDKSDRRDEKDPRAAAARGRERGRISAIMKSAAAAQFPAAALELALGTSASRKSALATLRAMSAAMPEPAPPDTRREQARTRLAQTSVPDVGTPGSAPAGADAMAMQMTAAYDKARGVTKK